MEVFWSKWHGKLGLGLVALGIGIAVGVASAAPESSPEADSSGAESLNCSPDELILGYLPFLASEATGPASPEGALHSFLREEHPQLSADQFREAERASEAVEFVLESNGKRQAFARATKLNDSWFVSSAAVCSELLPEDRSGDDDN